MRILNQKDPAMLQSLESIEKDMFNFSAVGRELMSRFPCAKVAQGDLDHQAPSDIGFPYKGALVNDGAFGG